MALKTVHVGSLNFDFSQGGCSLAGDRLSLCFDFENSQTCWITTGTIEQFEQVVNSIHPHRRIRIADNNGWPFRRAIN